MASNIRSMMYVGEVPWHGLGKKLEKEATAAEAIVAAGLDWKVTQRPLIYRSPVSGLTVSVHDKVANVRGDTGEYIGTVGTGYRPVQNSEAFSFFDSVVGDGKAIYHTAGQLGIGERVWMLAKLPGDLLIRGKDQVEKYMLLSNCHDGSAALRMMLTPIRVVCQNTLNSALALGGDGITIRHSGDIKSKIREAQRALGIAHGFYLRFGAFAEALAARQMVTGEVDRFVDAVLPIRDGDEASSRLKGQREEVYNWIRSGAGHREIGNNTAWAAVNGVAEWADHHRSFRGENPEEKRSNRLESIWFGTSARIKEGAFLAIQEVTGIHAEAFGKN